MGSIANRPIIMAQLWHNYEDLVEKIHDHFDKIKVIINFVIALTLKIKFILNTLITMKYYFEFTTFS